MKQFLLPIFILLLSGWGQLHAHQSCIRERASEPVTGPMLPSPLVGEETIALADGYPSSDGEKQIIKMAPTEVTEEEDDDHEWISFKYFAAFFFAQTLHNVKERLHFCPYLTRVSAARRHLLFEVFRI